MMRTSARPLGNPLTRLEVAAGLLDDVDGLQVGAALQPQDRIHRELGKLILRLHGQWATSQQRCFILHAGLEGGRQE